MLNVKTWQMTVTNAHAQQDALAMLIEAANATAKPSTCVRILCAESEPFVKSSVAPRSACARPTNQPAILLSNVSNYCRIFFLFIVYNSILGSQDRSALDCRTEGCGKNAECIREQAFFVCRCKPGYSGEPETECRKGKPLIHIVDETSSVIFLYASYRYFCIQYKQAYYDNNVFFHVSTQSCINKTLLQDNVSLFYLRADNGTEFFNFYQKDLF